MEILTSVRRLYISFKSLVNDSVYSFVRAALLLLVEVQNHTVPVRERRRIRVKVTPVSLVLHVLPILFTFIYQSLYYLVKNHHYDPCLAKFSILLFLPVTSVQPFHSVSFSKTYPFSAVPPGSCFPLLKRGFVLLSWNRFPGVQTILFTGALGLVYCLHGNLYTSFTYKILRSVSVIQVSRT